MKWKYVLIIAPILIIILGISLWIFLPPKFDVSDKTAEYKEKYSPHDFKVTRFGIDYTKKVKVINKVKTDKLGSYKVIYKVKIGLLTFKKQTTVKVVDTKLPEISLNGNEEVIVCPNVKYQDEGAKAIDNYDGDITSKIKTNILDDKVIYEVKDSSGNKTSKTRNIVYDDKESPKLSLKGSSTIYLTVGSKYIEPGAAANDNCDGDISNKITTEGVINTNQAGTYTLTYSAVDTKNNKGSITRKVVVSRQVVNNSGKAGTIYLTFDDGPNQGTTNVILDILKEEGVKATFFVTGKGPDSLIKREFDEGHTVALHTYSHNYASCYSSVDGYFNDLNQIQNRVKNITGSESKIIRFPGGSSNTVSRKYSQGIMTTLSREVTNRGYQYYDWNVSSGDAGGATTASGVYNNVIKGLQKNRANIILMHDIKTYTRDAIRNIIRYGKQNGYAFEKITTSTAPYHQKINN